MVVPPYLASFVIVKLETVKMQTSQTHRLWLVLLLLMGIVTGLPPRMPGLAVKSVYLLLLKYHNQNDCMGP